LLSFTCFSMITNLSKIIEALLSIFYIIFQD